MQSALMEEGSSTGRSNLRVVGIAIPSVLLDPLERGLRESGFVPVLLPDYQAAATLLETTPVDALLTYFEVPLESERLNAISEFVRRSRAMWLVLVNGSSLSDRLAIYQRQPDDLVQLPVTAGEIVARMERLRAERGAEVSRRVASTQALSGSLRDMKLVDLLHLLTVGGKTGVIVLRAESREGYVFVEHGRLIDAVLNSDPPEMALLRMLLWDEGEYELRFGDFERPGSLSEQTVESLLEEQRRLRSLLAELGGSGVHPERRLAAVDAEPEMELSAEEKKLLAQLNGRRSLLDVLLGGVFPPEKCLELLRGLVNKGLVGEVKSVAQPTGLDVESRTSRALSTLASLVRTDARDSVQPARPIRRVFRGRVSSRPGLSRSELLQLRQNLLKR